MSCYKSLFNRVQNISNLLIPLVIKQNKILLQRGEISAHPSERTGSCVERRSEVETWLGEGFSWSSFTRRHTFWRGWWGPGWADTTSPSQVIYSKSGLSKSVWSFLVVTFFMLWGIKRMNKITLTLLWGLFILGPLERGTPGMQCPAGGDEPSEYIDPQVLRDLNLPTSPRLGFKTPSLNSLGIKEKLGYTVMMGLCFVVAASAALVNKELDWTCLFLPRKWALPLVNWIAPPWTRDWSLGSVAFVVSGI